MSDAMSQVRFPLYLTPLEGFMRADDRPAYPMTFVIQWDFSGTIDRPAFEAAMQEELERNPLLRAVIRPAKRNQPCWVLDDGAVPPVDWGDGDKPVECPGGEAIDIARQPGFRLWVRQGGGTTRITMQLHHATSDGIGVYRFMGNVLALYGQRTAPEHRDRYEPGLLKPSLLRTRKNGTLDLAASGTAIQVARSAIGDAARIFGRRTQPLQLPADKSEPGYTAPFPGIESVRFDPNEHKQLRAAAVEQGVTVNDLLLAEFLQTLAEWNLRNSGRRGNRPLTIMMPIDLRSGDHLEMPAANMTGYTFVARRPREFQNRGELLAGIRHETALIKHERRGTRFVDTVFAGQRIPGLLPFLLSSGFCLATAVLSNVGDPARRWTARLPRDKGRVVAGNLVLEDVTGVPPLRPKTRATLSVFTYRRGLTLSLRCDPYTFRPEDTRALLELLAGRIRRAGGL